ncbi:hypothetical protein BS78_05G258400 [Paspalum vaginatum]|nr:hypothetical protein BS78_05G258400 [Paspalum vaginatum]
MATALWMPWCIAVVGWMMNPIICFFLNKLFCYLGFDISRELQELERSTVPNLKLALRDAMEQMMPIEANDEGKKSEPDVRNDLQNLAEGIKSALYDAEDILDLVEYYRAKKEAIGDDKSIWQRLHGAFEAFVASCKGIEAVSPEKFQQYGQGFERLSRKLEGLLQWAKNLNQQTQQRSAAVESPTPHALSTAEFSTVDIEQGSAAQTQTPRPPDASSNYLAEMIRYWYDIIVTSSSYGSILSWLYWSYEAVSKIITTCYQLILYVISVLRGIYCHLCSWRDWSYESLGIQAQSSVSEATKITASADR